MATNDSPSTDSSSPEPANPEPADDLVRSTHTLSTADGELAYTAHAGRLVLRKEVVTDGTFDGHKPTAEVFVTSYTADGADPGTRPVTFAFNGGPGSSSVWLHLGLFGPRRVVSGDVGALEPPPYRLADNPESLLAHTDLVFIDPVSTGFSRATQGQKPGDHHGFTGDLESVGEIIRLWTTRNERWLSPKFLAGESYGALRAAALAEHLQTRYAMYLNGLMLISATLDLGTLNAGGTNDRPYPLFLPTYAAIAQHHGRLGDRPLTDVLAEAEQFAAADYPWALAQGARLPREDRDAVVTRLASLTGLSTDYIDRVDLRIEHLRFCTELLRDQRLVVGRMDGRFTGPDTDYGREYFSGDPCTAALLGPYSAALNHYVRAELQYHNDLPYEVLNIDAHQAWSYSEFEGKHVAVTDTLAKVLRTNPHMKVHVSLGYTDGATAYYATEQSLAQLQIPASTHANITRAYYPAGHMMYVHEPSRIQQSADLAAFVRDAANR